MDPMRSKMTPAEGCVELVYYEVTEYHEHLPQPEQPSHSTLDGLSVVDTDSTATTLAIDEQTLDDDPCALWPPLHMAGVQDGASSRSSERSEPWEPESLEESAAALLALHVNVVKDTVLGKASIATHERGFHRRCPISCFDARLSMNQVLSRRSVAATVLTRGCPRIGEAPLPMLPEAVAQDIIASALPLAPPLMHFVNSTGVDIQSALSICHLNLASTGLNANTAGVVGWLLRQNKRLRTLDVSGNELGVVGATCIISSLPAALSSLLLNDVLMCSAGGTDPSALVLLAQLLDELPALQSLELRQNALGASTIYGVRVLSSALSRASCALRRLDLAGNSLQSAGAALMAVALLQTPRLEELNLSSNLLCGSFGKAREGIRAIAVALALNRTLRVLDLSSNAIGARRSESMDQWYKTPNCPTVHIVRALEHNSTLMELRLSDNHLVGRQGEELEQVWKRHMRSKPITV